MFYRSLVWQQRNLPWSRGINHKLYASNFYSSFIMQVVASFGQPPVVCIRTDSGYGVVSVSDSQKVQCTTCKHKKHHCDHVKFVEEMASSILDADMPDAISEFLHLLHQSSRRKPKKEWCSCVSSSKSFHFNTFTIGGA